MNIPDNAVMLVQDLGPSDGITASLCKDEDEATRVLAAYCRGLWRGRSGPGGDIPDDPKQIIETYYNPDLGGAENGEQWIIIPVKGNTTIL